MPNYPMMQVDAFANKALEGNPCAIVFETDRFSDDLMQAIAIENNLSETSYVSQSDKADFRVRYFTLAGEIPLAGHPTIATTHALMELGMIEFDGDEYTFTLEMQAGIIPVSIKRDGDATIITMTQNKPQFFDTYAIEDVMPTLGLTVEDALEGYPIQTVSTGTKQLMVPVKSQDALKRVRMNEQFRTLRETADFRGGAFLFVLQGISDAATTFARYMGLPPGVIEDPFTGSATGNMAAYLWKYGLLKEPTFIAEQGHWMKRPGMAYVEVVGARDNIESVKVGGEAVTVFDGTLRL